MDILKIIGTTEDELEMAMALSEVNQYLATKQSRGQRSDSSITDSLSVLFFLMNLPEHLTNKPKVR
ncbi:hypothetical protein [Ruminococcus albus]|uniref:Uncharacterized protein n=1 Tax=Ruminococcus albus (strain ATCC 27210 / DSM 20455 / JCM 14654 / NCDO 2250 / 7) TaxID=697329 RepID=E6UG99_RUMA7|nr:hypothetical protein [Ruminococcus albus]ADU21937.1 hypothetical protein Rumal_1423 [Ruminococcus albus 7 = DSM 20455]